MARHVRWILAVLLMGIAPALRAQISKGNVYGTVVDESQAILPGASVTLGSEYGSPLRTVSGTDGGFRFKNLDHGRHELTVSLSGFKTVKRAVVVEAGSNSTFHFELEIATLEEVVEVSAASPMVDPRKFGSQTTLSRAELDRVPQARDPWDLLKTVPGIVVSLRAS